MVVTPFRDIFENRVIMRKICVDRADKVLQDLPQRLALDLRAGGRAVAAAAELFEHHLHIARADGARADDDLFAVREEDERSGDAGDVDELIGRLRGDGAGDGLVQAGDGELAAVEPGGLHDAVAGERIVQIVWNSFLTSTGSARLAQIGRGLKRARAGADGEILRINTIPASSACASSGRTSRWLTAYCRSSVTSSDAEDAYGSCRLRTELLDIICCAAVVVDDRNTGNRFQQRAALDLLRAVRIDDDEQAPRLSASTKGILSGDEQILETAGRSLELSDQALAGVFLQVDHDPGGRSFYPAQAQKTHGRAERVQIGHAVAHDKTVLDCPMSSDSEPAITRDLTRVCRSASLVRPP